jgi:phosphohistidine swiveling domain-containing protein
MLVLPGSTDAFARREAGGKGWNLHRLQQLGMPVPPFCVLGHRFFRQFLASTGLGPRLDLLLADLAAGRTTPEQVEAEAARWFDQTPLDPAFEGWVAQAYQQVAGDGGTISVRSSAADEDSDAHSFAGQLSSFLYVEGPAAAGRCLRRCWASGFSARGLHYRRGRGLALQSIAVAVVFQRMVDPDVAGVLFTCDPATDSLDRFTVSAVYGAGEGLVSGALDADTFQLEAASGKLAGQQIVAKTEAFRRGADGTCARHPVAPARQNASSLSPAQLHDLWDLGRRLAVELHQPQDVEWAITADGALHVLQTRPVTTLARQSAGYPNLWDNSNIVESYGGLTAPLSFTFALRNYRNVYVQFCEILGVPPPVVRDMEPYLGNMLGCIHGRVFYNLYNWYKLVGVLPGFRHNREFMETMMGVKEALTGEIAERIRPHPSWDTFRGKLRRLWVGVRFFGYHLRIQSLCDQFLRFFDRAYRRFRALDYRQMRSDEIFAAYLRMEQEMLGQWKAPIINDFLCMVHFGMLRKLTVKWLAAVDPDIHNDLLAADGNLESAEPTRMLLRLARGCAEDPALRQLILDTPAADLMEALHRQPAHRAFFQQLQSYIDRFGFRCMSEMKLEETDLHADPAFLFVVLKNYLGAPALPDPEAQVARERQRRTAAEGRVRQALRGPRRWLYFWSLRHARKAVRNRENTRFARTRAYGVTRAMFRAMGEDLAARGILASAGDIFHLTLDEVAGLHQGTLPAFDLPALAAHRRQEYARFADQDPLPRFLTRGPVYWRNPVLAGSAATTAPPAPGATGEQADLRGTPCCPGVVEGVIKVVTSPADDLRLAGEILVAPRTDPGWVPLYPSVSGLLVEKGSLLSHSAIVAREMGLPAIVGIPGLLRTLRSGMRVRMDGQRGVVTILDGEARP